jgi:hypothetical protein
MIEASELKNESTNFLPTDGTTDLPPSLPSATELIQPETPLVLLHYMYVLAVCTATFCVSVVCNYYYEEN